MKKYILLFLLLPASIRMVVAQCTANAGPSQTLTCFVPSVTLQGSSNVSGATYFWAGPNSFNSILQNPVVSAPGVYTLTITDPANGCTASATTTVFQNQTIPTIDVQANGVITCTTPQVTVSGTVFPQNCSFAWTGPSGFSSQQQSFQTSNPGSYTVTVTNPGNGCTATGTALVQSNTVIPIASAIGGTITCAFPTVTLQGGASSGSNIVYAWTGPGISAANVNLQNPLVNVGGQYTLTVTDMSNGCSSSATTSVLVDITLPNVSATGGDLSCAMPSVTIQASSTSLNPSFIWAGPGGFISTLQNPTVTNAGDYIVTVTTPNGCTATAVATVTIGPGAPSALAIVAPPKCFGNADGQIDITPGGGTPGYTFNWSGPNGFTANTEDIAGLVAGTYALILTDGSGCSSIQSYIVISPLKITVPANQITIQPVLCFGDTNGGIVIHPAGGSTPYLYAWTGPNGFTAGNTADLQGLAAGGYNLTITDSKGCSATSMFLVPGPAAALSIANTFVCDQTLSVSVTGGSPPYQYFWSDGELGPVAAPQNDGTYHVTISDANNCFVETTLVLSSASTTPCTRISGQVRWDLNKNCTADAGEPGLSGFFVKATGTNGIFYGLSDATGQYSVSLLPGDYTVTLIPKSPTSSVCTNDVSVSLAATGDVAPVDYLIQQPLPECPHLTVDLNVQQLRRCANSYYYLKYCNNGPVEASFAYVILHLDSFLVFHGSQKAATYLGNRNYRFDLGTVQPGQCNTFWVLVEVPCNALLGQVHCSEAHIYPDSTCDPVNPAWSGALVEVISQCTGDSLHFILENTGIAPMSAPLEYIVIEDGIMSLQGAGPPLDPKQTMAVNVPANGATWRIEAKQEPQAPVLSKPVLSVEGCSNTGSFSTGYVNQFALNDADPWVDINCTANIGSFDPNDKEGYPTGYGPSHYIRPGTELEYKIRFQNTGTDTAFQVVIRDTLSPWLDPLTIRPGVSSHPHQFQLAGDGVLIFDFQNIMLPDSNVNEPESHGFVQFRVSPRSGVPLETDIPNQAAIYFDFNDPVITNTTTHRIGENFVSIGLWQPQQPAYTVQVAPNPLEQSSRITVEGIPAQGHYQLEVFDAIGRRVRNLSAGTPVFLLRKDALAEGVYLFRIALEGRLIGSGKLMVK